MYLLIVDCYGENSLYYFWDKQEALTDKQDWNDRGYDTYLYRIIEVKEQNNENK